MGEQLESYEFGVGLTKLQLLVICILHIAVGIWVLTLEPLVTVIIFMGIALNTTAFLTMLFDSWHKPKTYKNYVEPWEFKLITLGTMLVTTTLSVMLADWCKNYIK